MLTLPQLERIEAKLDLIIKSLGYDAKEEKGEEVMPIVCWRCNKIITGFKDELSKKEYQISGLCQSCQDEIFDSELAKGVEEDND